MANESKKLKDLHCKKSVCIFVWIINLFRRSKRRDFCVSHAQKEKKAKIRYNRHSAHRTPSSATAPAAPCGVFFLCVSVERSAFRGTREEERGCFGGGGEEVKTRGMRVYSPHNLSPPQTHLSASLSRRLSNCFSFMFLHWYLSSFMSVTQSPPQSFYLPLTILQFLLLFPSITQTNLSPPQAPSFLYAMWCISLWLCLTDHHSSSLALLWGKKDV